MGIRVLERQRSEKICKSVLLLAADDCKRLVLRYERIILINISTRAQLFLPP